MNARHLLILVPALCAGPSLAQDDLPNGRRQIEGPPTVLAFKGVTVEDLIPFIVTATGKVVLPQDEVLRRSITVVNDREIPRQRALDMVFLALQQAGIAVVESDEIITLRDLAEIDRQDVPVIGPEETVLGRTDYGTFAEKIYRLNSSTAETLGEMLEDSIPDYAKLAIDEESNQIALMGNIALLQRVERLVASLDRPASGSVVAETFRLRYADAELLAENIRELYEDDESQQGGRGGNQNNARFNFGNRGQQQQEESSAGPSANLRVTANTQQNSVTVVAEPAVVAEIRGLISNQWDLPLDDEAVIPKIYDLENSDPIKVRDLLEQLFGEGTPAQGQGASSSQGVGRLAGQFSFEAIPEAGRLVVVAKSPDNLAVIDKIVADLDQPQTAGLPELVELKHAAAEDLSEQLNTLLAEEGTLAQLPRQERGLSEGEGAASPFANQQDQQAADDANDPGTITFWWQRSRPPTDSAGASNLVGFVRIVPVWRQNAVLVLAPPEYKRSIVNLIEALDQPGRQVMLSAIIAEVAINDATSLGFRWSSNPIDLLNTENALQLGLNAVGQATNIAGSLFDTSVLDASIDLNVVLQLLNEKSDVSVLSEPRVFTSDNQEAEFFDGQDIPFVTDSQVTDTGNVINSFDYRAVGIRLAARPRITTSGNIDLRVNVELSSIDSGQQLFGAFVVDRRETTTEVIVQNGQTIVISGILRSEMVDIVRKVPLLGDIPIVKWLFRSTDKQKQDTELLIFITPIVVNNSEEANRLNEENRRRLQELREMLGTPAGSEGSLEDDAIDQELDDNSDGEMGAAQPAEEADAS